MVLHYCANVPLSLNEPVTFARCADAIFSLHVYGGPPGPERTYDDRVAIDFVIVSLRSQLVVHSGHGGPCKRALNKVASTRKPAAH